MWHGRTEVPEVPGRCKHAVPVPRVFVAPAYRSSRRSGYGYNCLTEVPEVLCKVIPGVNTPGMVLCVPTEITKIESLGTGMNVQNSQTFRVGRAVQIPGTGMSVSQELQKFFVG